MTSPNKNENENNDNNKNRLTILDRSVPIVVLPNTTTTINIESSSNNNNNNNNNTKIPISLQRLHKVHGTTLIFESSKLLNIGASTFATACTIFHRFYIQCCLSQYDVWSVAMASTLLATKIEEEPQTLKSFIHVYCHLYRKRILLIYHNNNNYYIDNNNNNNSSSISLYNHPQVSCLDVAKEWTYLEKEQYLQQLQLPNKLSDSYSIWHKQLTDMEAILLRQLGFTLYWIPDSHPHKFILYFCRVLELTDDKFSQRAWNYCNDSCRLDLCVRYEPQVIASSSILLAANDFDISLPIEPCPWWEVFIGKNSEKQLVNAANAILGLVIKKTNNNNNNHNHQDGDDGDDWIIDSNIASKAYLKSLLPLGDSDGGENQQQRISFIDEGSFLWEEHKNLFELKKPTNT